MTPATLWKQETRFPSALSLPFPCANIPDTNLYYFQILVVWSVISIVSHASDLSNAIQYALADEEPEYVISCPPSFLHSNELIKEQWSALPV